MKLRNTLIALTALTLTTGLITAPTAFAGDEAGETIVVYGSTDSSTSEGDSAVDLLISQLELLLSGGDNGPDINEPEPGGPGDNGPSDDDDECLDAMQDYMDALAELYDELKSHGKTGENLAKTIEEFGLQGLKGAKTSSTVPGFSTNNSILFTAAKYAGKDGFDIAENIDVQLAWSDFMAAYWKMKNDCRE